MVGAPFPAPPQLLYLWFVTIFWAIVEHYRLDPQITPQMNMHVMFLVPLLEVKGPHEA